MDFNKPPRLKFYNDYFEHPYASYKFAYIDMIDGKRMVAKPIELEEVDVLIKEPTFRLDQDAMQNLMNDMWVAGLRPSQSLVEPQNLEHLNTEIKWHRDVIDHLIKRKV